MENALIKPYYPSDEAVINNQLKLYLILNFHAIIYNVKEYKVYVVIISCKL
jgi:hypothetical protein